MHVTIKVVKPRRRKPDESPRLSSPRAHEHARGWLISAGSKTHLAIRNIPVTPQAERGFLIEAKEVLVKHVADAKLIEEFMLDLVEQLAPHRFVDTRTAEQRAAAEERRKKLERLGWRRRELVGDDTDDN